jgi:hypothetical protein
VVNQLGRAPEYQGKVLFLDHDVDDTGDGRRRIWWTAKQAEDPSVQNATTPLIMADSGRTLTDGRGQPFEQVYRGLVDEALTEPPLVKINATFERDPDVNRVWVRGTITNISDMTIGYDNTATLWYLAYVEEQVHYVDWFVFRTKFQAIEDDLAPGATMPIEMALVLKEEYIDQAKVVVMLDYKPADQNGKYWSANAALAVKVEPGAPTPTPLPSILSGNVFLPVGLRRAPVLAGP